ncbi:hypothetical protein [Pedobacter sp. L105]|uniref:hypothetical protein n=1 Tax=Pedobacter sp. L105 TaxID=1641871 RepID=UPI00131BA41D|nr:hypothetical protein [Pedobacter sp. L105]
MLLLQLFILICLGLICYQDMRYRAVYWICFPFLGILLLLFKQQHTSMYDVLTESVYAFLFIGIQFVLLSLYFSLKNKRFINITHQYLGWGDILFLLAITFYLSPVNYVLFYVGSLIVVLLYTFTQQILLKKVNPQIPLAGLQALLLCFVLVFSLINPSFKLYTDSWIYGI